MARQRDYAAERERRKQRQNQGEANMAEAKTTTETTDTPKRGRPRPTDVIDRDEAVFNAVSTTPKSTEELAESVGAERNATYASLFRLRRDGRIARAKDESGAEVRGWVRA